MKAKHIKWQSCMIAVVLLAIDMLSRGIKEGIPA